MKQYYKWLKPDRMPAHGGVGQWPEPGVWAPGVWVDPCKSGYHVCHVEHLSRWMPYGTAELWTVDGRGYFARCDDKHVWGEARLCRRLIWPLRSRQLLACDFAAHVLHIYERSNPRDMRPRNAVVAGRKYIAGQASDAERDAALDAAWAATRDAAGAAAWAAARAAALDAAAWAAARAAALDATWDAARKWQGERILYYADCAERGIVPEPWPLPGKPKEHR